VWITKRVDENTSYTYSASSIGFAVALGLLFMFSTVFLVVRAISRTGELAPFIFVAIGVAFVIGIVSLVRHDRRKIREQKARDNQE
jgi:cobalamin biosynthesis protein CobD/CbiB